MSKSQVGLILLKIHLLLFIYYIKLCHIQYVIKRDRSEIAHGDHSSLEWDVLLSAFCLFILLCFFKKQIRHNKIPIGIGIHRHTHTHIYFQYFFFSVIKGQMYLIISQKEKSEELHMNWYLPREQQPAVRSLFSEPTPLMLHIIQSSWHISTFILQNRPTLISSWDTEAYHFVCETKNTNTWTGCGPSDEWKASACFSPKHQFHQHCTDYSDDFNESRHMI